MDSEPEATFEWDRAKDLANQAKHGVSFGFAQYAFADSKRVILIDATHSTQDETRYYCVCKVGDGIVTVRFTYRERRIRIFGAGYWRGGKRIYEEQNQVQ
jgi:uncharacterized DUF497 family protein